MFQPLDSVSFSTFIHSNLILPTFLTFKIAFMSSEEMDHSEVSNSKVNWLPLVLGAVLVLGLIIFIFKGCSGSNG
jgi:hypothetical protein